MEVDLIKPVKNPIRGLLETMRREIHPTFSPACLVVSDLERWEIQRSTSIHQRVCVVCGKLTDKTWACDNTERRCWPEKAAHWGHPFSHIADMQKRAGFHWELLKYSEIRSISKFIEAEKRRLYG